MSTEKSVKQIEKYLKDLDENPHLISKRDAENFKKYMNGEMGAFQFAGSYTDKLDPSDTELQNYSLDIQNELNEFNKENVRYQANVQAEIQKHQSDLQKALNQANIDAADARQEAQQATQVDLANKAADQALALQNAAQTMAAAIQNNDDILVKFNAEIQKYSAQVADEIQEYNANLQKDIAKYSWYEKQYAAIDARYKEQIQTLQGVL